MTSPASYVDESHNLIASPAKSPTKLGKKATAAAKKPNDLLNSSISSSSSNSNGMAPTCNGNNGMQAVKFSSADRIDLTSKLLENNNSDLVLNCVQLVNFIDFYFNETTATTVSSCSSHSPLHACFPCIVCSMQFSFDQTFHMHLERKSAVIRVYCLKCDSLKKFYNKCKLLYHVYSHKMTLFEPIYKSIQIESLPMIESSAASSLGGGGKERSIDVGLIFSNVFQAETTSQGGSGSSMDNLNTFKNGFKLCENDLMQVRMFFKRLVLSDFLVYKCQVCDALFFHLKDLKHHYASSQRIEFNFMSMENSASSSSSMDTVRLGDIPGITPYVATSTPATSPPPPPTTTTTTPSTPIDFQQNQNNTIFNRAYFQILKQKNSILHEHNPLNKKLFKDPIGDLFATTLNHFSFKKLQFSNRCYTLASNNLVANNAVFTNQKTTLPPPPLNSDNMLICPECGLCFDGKRQANAFRMHLIYECLFTIKYKPPQVKCYSQACDLLFESVDEAAAHWCHDHILKLHQCGLCDRKGLEFFFNETASMSSQSQSQSNLTISSNTEDTSSILKNILDSSSDNNNLTNLNRHQLSASIVSQINKHYFEKHRNQPISLKLIYKCQCKVNQSSDTNRECLSTRLEIVQKHSVNLVTKAINTISCLLCRRLVAHEEYQSHMSLIHAKERFCICPMCGFVRNENVLHNHILKHHSDVNGKANVTSSFFNMISTFCDKPQIYRSQSSKKKDSSAGGLQLNGSASSSSSSNFNFSSFPSDLFVYQCVNCRLFFSSNSTFSHNCLVAVVDKQPPTYFSPIYLKFSLSKFQMLLSNSHSNLNSNETNTNNSQQFSNNKRVKYSTTDQTHPNAQISNNEIDSKILENYFV